MEPINDVALHPLHLFAQQIKQPTIKLKSIRSVSTIALALGPQQTRQALLPFLSALFHQQNLECQLTILQVLPSLIQYLGHSFYSYLILEVIMDILCLYDQKEIRDVAFVCLFKILSRIDIRKAQEMLYNTLREIETEKELRIKELVIRMIAPIFIGLEPEYQHKFLEIFIKFSDDEKEEVRAVVAAELNELIRIMPPAPQAQIKMLLEKFLNDTSEKVKVHLLESIILLNQLLGEEVVAPYLKKLISDPNNKVKCQLYSKIETLAKQFSPQLLSPFYSQIEGFSTFEQEVKNKILGKLPILFQIYPKNISEIYLQQLLLPPSNLVLKSTLAQSLCILKDEEHLKIILQQGDNSFKIKLLSKIPNLSRQIQTLKELTKHRSYRIRVNILNNIQTRISDEFQNLDKLLQVVLDMICDKVAVVRTAASKLASKIIQNGKMETDKVKQKLQPFIQNKVWYVRFSALEIIKKLVGNKFYLKLWEVARSLLNDKVMCIKMDLVEIADKINEHGVKSCADQVKALKAQTQSIFLEIVHAVIECIIDIGQRIIVVYLIKILNWINNGY